MTIKLNFQNSKKQTKLKTGIFCIMYYQSTDLKAQPNLSSPRLVPWLCIWASAIPLLLENWQILSRNLFMHNQSNNFIKFFEKFFSLHFSVVQIFQFCNFLLSWIFQLFCLGKNCAKSRKLKISRQKMSITFSINRNANDEFMFDCLSVWNNCIRCWDIFQVQCTLFVSPFSLFL